VTVVTKSAGRDSKELITRAAVRRLLILEVLAIERVQNWEGEKFHFPNFFNMCALRRTLRLRAMGALSQVKVVCSASCYQLASESLVKVIASEPCSEPPMLLGD
ncbi:hypothetical protein ACTM9V_13220, partial [Oliverpabstia intestinalis]|uniref:hypothetical protein n=1 Tax=Oliverpabstia intestinalis TaxID=2606633 RepID=UPI003F898B1E